MTKVTAIPLLEQRPSATPAEAIRDLAQSAIARALPAGRGSNALCPVRSLYIHVPFCSHKCHYCDFYSIVDTQDRQEAFVRRLVRELRAWSPLATGAPLRTVFVGGGTPSLLRVDLWGLVLRELGNLYDLSDIKAGRGEFTVECNPESVTPELLGVLVAGGVDRISMGAQSFETRHLRTLERRHDPESVARAHDMVRAWGVRRTSIDLIYAIPGQTPADFEQDLERAIALGTEHVSCYNLTYEPATAMTARLARGMFTPADEDTEIEMFTLCADRLQAAGFDRYEISNYARGGAQCRHNLAYWRQEQWLACGPSAAAHVMLPTPGLAGPADRPRVLSAGDVGPYRWKNVPRLDDYLQGDADGFAPAQDLEGPDPRRALVERIMTGLRLAEGLDAADILARAACVDPDAPTRLESRVHHAVQVGHLDGALVRAGRWCLTPAGLLVSNAVARTLISAL